MSKKSESQTKELKYVRAKKSARRYLALALAALVSIPLSLSGLWVESQKAEASAPEIDYSVKVSDGVLRVLDPGTSSALDPGSTKTIELWFKANSIATDGVDKVILEKNLAYAIVLNNDKIRYYSGASGGWTPSRTGELTINAGEWYHVGLVFAANEAYLFINGNQVVISSAGSTYNQANYYPANSVNNNQVSVGSWSNGSGRFLGEVDQVKLWNTDRRSSLSSDMHSWQSSDATLPVVHWDFNVGTGTTVEDEIGALDLTNSTSSSVFYSDVKSESSPAGKKVLTFPRSYLTSTGGWAIPADVTETDVLVVGGGGAGGTVWVGSSGGGGGGRVQETLLKTSGASHLAVKVGTGGIPTLTTALATTQNSGGNGGSSSVLTPSGTGLTSLGGGAGANSRRYDFTQWIGSTTGWTGGGGSSHAATASFGSTGLGGSSFKGGNGLGNGTIADPQAAGGGGGAGGAGVNASSGAAGAGGPGVSSQLSGTSTSYGGGGGGGKRTASGSAGSGGSGGGGAGGKAGSSAGDGLSGRGGGGGGAGEGADQIGGSGGSGVVIIQYDIRQTPVVSVADISVLGASATASTSATASYGGSNVAGSWAFSSSATSIATVAGSGATVTATGVSQGVARLTTTFTPTSSTVYRTVTVTSLISVTNATSCGTQTSNLTFNTAAVAGTKDCYVRFTQGTGTWTVPEAISAVRLLIIGGGGSGGGSGYGAGGGAGAMYEVSSFSVTPSNSVAVEVGAGGAGVLGEQRGNNGGFSKFATLQAEGGGAGGGYGWNDTTTTRSNRGFGLPGGSGGGTGEVWTSISDLSGVAAGAVPPSASGEGHVYSQNPGGGSSRADSQAGSGGGGAGGSGQGTALSRGYGGAGGLGKSSNITGGNPKVYAAGGGGGTGNASLGTTNKINETVAERRVAAGEGGDSSAGRGGFVDSAATSGDANSGSGGGGSGNIGHTSGSGGSGVVIARYTRAEPTITQADITRVLTAGVLNLAPTSSVAGGTFSYAVLDGAVATVDGSALRPISQGTTSLAITFTPTNLASYYPTTKFVKVTITASQTVPEPPLSVQAVKGSNSGEAVVSWSAPGNNGGSEITLYTVTANPGGATCSTAGLTCTISGLVAGVTYTFSVVAKNATGNSDPAVSNALALISPIPVGAVCSASLAAQNGISVEPAHGTVMYIDTGQGQEIDAGYIGYRVKSATARQDLWVEVSGFTGGVVSLASPADKALPLGALAAGETGTAYYLVKATGATNVAQGHTVKVYSSKPTIGSPSPIFECGFSFVEVAETIKAAANKVDSIVSTQVRSIGSTMTITVLGDSGTIGQGNSIDGRMFALLPAARSNWPTGALRLEEVRLQLYSNSNRSTLLSEHVDHLRVNANTPHVSPNGFSTTSRQYYRATYTFRVIGSAAAAAPIIPIAMISSGTQIKHTDVGSLPTGGSATVDVTQPPVDMKVIKSASTTSVVSEDGTTALSYTINLQNNGQNTLIVDEIIDSPDPVMTFKQASGKFDGVAIVDAGTLANGKYAFSGPFEVPAGQTKQLTYQMFTTTCAPGGSYNYDNIATAQVGSVIIGSAAATQSVVTVGGKCGEPEVNVEVKNVPIPPEVQTSPAANITTTSATLRGVVDPNGGVGLPIRILYSTSPTMSSPVTINLASSTASAIGYPVSTNVSGLLAGLTYYYRVEIGTTPTSGLWVLGEVVSFTLDEAAGGSASATTLRVNEISTTSARIFGNVDPANVPGGAKVRFDLGIDSSGNGTCSVAPASISTGTVLRDDEVTPAQDILATGSSPIEFNINLSNLTPSTQYCFRIVALYGTNYSSTSNGNWLPFSTIASIQPQVLEWNAITESGSAPVELEPGAGSTVTVSVDTSRAGSTAPVQYRSDSTSICTVDATTGVVSLASNTLREGTCTIVATKAGDAGYYPADPIVINITIATPRVTTTVLPDGEYLQSSEYNSTLVADGGNGTNTWALCSLSAGEKLPDGLSLNTATGVISGTPTKAGVYNFKVCVTSNGITSDPQSLTIKISKAPLTVYASSPTVSYRDAIPTITPTYEGFRSLTQTETAIRPVCVTNYVVGTGVTATESLRRTTCSSAHDDNYTVTTYVNGLVTVNKLTITVTALNAIKYNQVSGDTTTVFRDPALHYTISPALLPTETETDLYSGGLTISRANSGGALGQILTASLTTERVGEVTGNFVISPAGSGTVGPNYTVTFVNGTFQVQTTKVAIELSADTSDKRITAGQTLDGQLTADLKRVDNNSQVTTGITCVYKNGTDVLSSSTVLRPGTYTITVECTTDGSTYVSTVFGSYTITVDPAPITIRALDTQKWQGTRDPVFDYEVVGSLIPGLGHTTATLGRVTLSRAAGEAIGDYAITPAGASHPDYTITFQTGKLYIAKVTISVQEQNGVLTTNQVTCACEGLKPGATTTLQIFSTPTTIATVTAAADGTCPLLANQTIPGSVNQGNHTLKVESLYPTGVTLSTQRPVALLPAPPVAPPLEDEEELSPNNNGGGGGITVTPTPTPTITPTNPRPRPTPAPNRPNPPGFVPGSVTPAPTPSARPNDPAPSDPLAKGPTGTVADPLAAPPIANPPRLPGVLNPRSQVIPGANESVDPESGATRPGAGFVAQNPERSTVDFGAGIQAAGSLTDSTIESGKRTVGQLSEERIGGFSPGSGLRIEVLGARTGARFVLADLQAIDAVALIRAMEASITTQEADFSKITRVVRGERPLIQKSWTPEVREGINEFFEAVGLDAPRALIDLDLNGVDNWVSIQAEVETYQPGSTVFLIATSSPIVLATAEVDQFGKAQLAGAMPVEALGNGEHRVRVVGIRSLEGVSVDGQGEIQLSADLMDEIQRFDLGTQSTIALSGLNPEGGYHSAIRVVPLIPVAPWWTLWFILAGFVLAIGARYRRYLDTASRRIIAASGVVASALPAVIIGWVSTVTNVVWVGILLGLVGAVLSWFMPEQKKPARRK